MSLNWLYFHDYVAAQYLLRAWILRAVRVHVATHCEREGLTEHASALRNVPNDISFGELERLGESVAEAAEASGDGWSDGAFAAEQVASAARGAISLSELVAEEIVGASTPAKASEAAETYWSSFGEEIARQTIGSDRSRRGERPSRVRTGHGLRSLPDAVSGKRCRRLMLEARAERSTANSRTLTFLPPRANPGPRQQMPAAFVPTRKSLPKSIGVARDVPNGRRGGASGNQAASVPSCRLDRSSIGRPHAH